MSETGRGALWKTARRVAHRMQLEVHRFRWFQGNRGNETSAANRFRRSHVSVGSFTYGPLRVIDGAGPSRLSIGSFCSIAEDVTFVLNAEHPLDRLSTFPLRAFVLGLDEPVESRGDIVVEDDVWFGHGATVLSGVSLGRGSVIAAGSVVTRSVASYSIVAGAPAREVRARLTPAAQDAAERIDLLQVDRDFVRANLESLESRLSAEVASDIEAALRRASPDGNVGS